ncbi:OVARIAN TUMOR DOMAIN-containing deubiquitinating enzyme 4 isoform X1 [Gossypium hirsutum]|uniref:Ubiquitin thioesterase OTU n=1 Tax=Gossypium hirsutum TaxID=3635 RepID=A0A1U8HZT9_GOSHI|nr:OVARIAN TUMOR DOMAIN-containing deubiquitinating enzyme 4 isoform X1 [Gossypium hirsutum]XP_016669463.1 OVARIAN TUMOR DOMAIN-containing deubiquitinating enzyme 4 isoform X1 [Gossypium hirsutum]XP_016669464.1 OVARIAN TUMOR DOMAIN-containing deubiquitinating enzyme 4 isoform X1 [Gossypium hirsutum]XP_040932536.1 OVARIAN TUMOR DOMAIN-containing deubiquitinating enzyme 4 isoform X1 [Gossypium hirsutum]
MMVCSPISTCVKNVVHLSGRMSSSLRGIISCGSSSSCCYCLYSGTKVKYTGLSVSNTTSFGCQDFQASCFRSSRRSGKFQTLAINESISNKEKLKRQLEISWAGQSMKMRLLLPKHGTFQKFKCIGGSQSWPPGSVSAGLAFGLLICYSSSEPVHAEAGGAKQGKEDEHDPSHAQFSHGKKVYTDYSVIGIPGDGRCMFRSVAHGACLRSGKSAPSEKVQRELADDLRAKVADEFIKRRKETEWFVEGDFDTYVSHIRKPHVWGGEPELFMSSHVLQMPITVYMYDRDAGGLIAIAEYGLEYGTENPIRVLYHGFGHYDALQMPGSKPGKSKL